VLLPAAVARTLARGELTGEEHALDSGVDGDDPEARGVLVGDERMLLEPDREAEVRARRQDGQIDLVPGRGQRACPDVDERGIEGRVGGQLHRDRLGGIA
jgi:hypothetical protein